MKKVLFCLLMSVTLHAFAGQSAHQPKVSDFFKNKSDRYLILIEKQDPYDQRKDEILVCKEGVIGLEITPHPHPSYPHVGNLRVGVTDSNGHQISAGLKVSVQQKDNELIGHLELRGGFTAAGRQEGVVLFYTSLRNLTDLPKHIDIRGQSTVDYEITGRATTPNKPEYQVVVILNPSISCGQM